MRHGQPGPGMTALERRGVFSLAGIFSLRMIGLFLILPVFALYAEDLQGVTPLYIGLAIGAYGFTQALFQIPLGMLSDRIGRKPVIIGGLLIFALGSIVAAVADSIYGVIAGRALQGAGAIAAAVMALAADLTREEHRTKAMAVIGVSIGMAFALSMILGPIVSGWIGISGIFWLTAVLALCGIGITLYWVPQPREMRVHRDAEAVSGLFRQVLSDPSLLRLDVGIFVLHLLMTALFLAVPLTLRDAGVAAPNHWQVYLPVLLASMLLMLPFIIIAEKHRLMKPVFLGAILALAIAQGGFWFLADSLVGMIGMLVLFFTAFNLLEASLPSLISKLAPVTSKGTAMGVYTSSQFLGAFMGGVLGGSIHGHYGVDGVFLFGLGAGLVWLLFAFNMSSPSHLSNHLIKIGAVSDEEATRIGCKLAGIQGVAEVQVIAEDGVAYLKVDKKSVDWSKLVQFSESELADEALG